MGGTSSPIGFCVEAAEAITFKLRNLRPLVKTSPAITALDMTAIAMIQRLRGTTAEVVNLGVDGRAAGGDVRVVETDIPLHLDRAELHEATSRPEFKQCSHSYVSFRWQFRL